MGQIVSLAAKPKRCNISQLSQLGTPAAGEHILLSSNNSMNAAGQGNFDCYIVGNGTTAAVSLEVHWLYERTDFELRGEFSRTYSIERSTTWCFPVPVKLKSGHTYTFNIAQTLTNRAVYVWIYSQPNRQGQLITLHMNGATSATGTLAPSQDYDTIYLTLYCSSSAVDGIAFSVTDNNAPMKKRVAVDEAQTFTDAEKQQARTNINAATQTELNETKSNVGSNTVWQGVFTQEDAIFKAQINGNTGAESSSGNIYNLIFKVWNLVHLESMLTDGYHMDVAIHSTYEGALKNTSATGSYFGRANTSTQNIYTQYRFGDSTAKNGYLMVRIKRSDGAALTSSDITAIENSLVLKFYPIELQGQILELDDSFAKLTNKTFTKNDFALFVSNSDGVSASNASGAVRVKFLKQNVEAGWKVSVGITNVLASVPLAVYGCQVFDTLVNAEKNASAGILETVITGWTDENKEGTITRNGVLNIYFKKSDNSGFTHEEILALQNNITISLSKVTAGNVDIDEEGEYDEIPLGEFALDSATVLTSDICCVPYQGATYIFVLPDGIKARVNEGVGLSLTNGTYVTNGNTSTLGASSMTQRFQFAKVSGDNLTIAEMNTFVSSSAVKILYKRRDLPVEKRNYDNEKFVKAALYRLGWTTEEVQTLQGLNSMPIITHTSDLHGDFKRFENFMEYSNIIKASVAVSTGDNVLYNYGNGSKYMKDVLVKHTGVPFASCIGNHECLPQNTYNNSDLFNAFVSPYITQGGYLASAGTTPTLPYYYIDNATYKLRLITINQFDNGCYYGEGLGGRLGQAQVTWLCNTLLSTPAGYGVVIAMHSNEAKVNTPQTMSAWNQTVNWDGRDEDTYGYAVNGLYVNAIRPIRTIVDAFISKTALSTSYDENTINGNNGETVTINVDFTNVNEGVEFICYITGHRHKDNVGYVDGATNKQLLFNIVSGNCHYPRYSSFSFAEGCDIPRGDRGATQDAFNVYAIDRKSGAVRVGRVGSDFTYEGVERKFLIAPYKD